MNKVKPILVSIGNVAAWLQAETWMGDRTIQDFGTQRYCPHFSSLNRTKSPYAMELTPRGGVSEKKKRLEALQMQRKQKFSIVLAG